MDDILHHGKNERENCSQKLTANRNSGGGGGTHSWLFVIAATKKKTLWH